MEMAYIPVFAKLPQPSEEEMLDLTKPAQMMYAENGYTQAIEGFSHAEDLDFLMKAAEQERLFLDILALPGFTEMDKWFGNPKYRFGSYNNLKFPRNYSSHHAQQHSDQRISGGIAGFGANPGKILIQSRFGDNASNIGKGKTDLQKILRFSDVSGRGNRFVSCTWCFTRA